jgi:hypothetical protein
MRVAMSARTGVYPSRREELIRTPLAVVSFIHLFEELQQMIPHPGPWR